MPYSAEESIDKSSSLTDETLKSQTQERYVQALFEQKIR
jgi:hypothetical protein